MPTFKENIDFAQKICKEIKTTTVSSHDIIPRTEMPFLNPFHIPELSKKYGERMVEYLAHLQWGRDNREKIRLSALRIPSGNTVGGVATALIGFGECEEVTYLAAIKSLLAGRCDISMIIVGGPAFENGQSYRHFFAVIGDTRVLNAGNSISALNDLDEDCVVLDGLLGHVGRAKDYLKERADYLCHYKYDRIIGLVEFNRSHLESAKNIMSNAQNLKTMLIKAGMKPYTRSITALPVEEIITAPVTMPEKPICYLFDIKHHNKESERFEVETNAYRYQVKYK